MTDYPNRTIEPPTPATGGGQQPGAAAGQQPGAAGGQQPASAYAAGYAPRPSFSPFDPRRKSPALASFLSIGPGLGQVYVGYYQRGFLHILTVAGIIAMLATGRLPDAAYPLLGIFLAFFWLYNIIDAGRRASLFNQALEGQEAGTLAESIELPRSGSMGGGLALIAAGLFFLMHTAFDWDFSWLEEWWPLFPIGFGVWLFLRGLMDRYHREREGDSA